MYERRSGAYHNIEAIEQARADIDRRPREVG